MEVQGGGSSYSFISSFVRSLPLLIHLANCRFIYFFFRSGYFTVCFEQPMMGFLERGEKT